MERYDFDIAVKPPNLLRKFISPQISFYCDKQTPFFPLPRSQSYPMLEWGMNWCIAAHEYSRLVNNIAIYLFSESHIALASPESLGGTQTVSFSYNFESGSSSEYTLSQPEHDEYNRTTPFGMTEDNASGEAPGNGNGKGNGKGNRK